MTLLYPLSVVRRNNHIVIAERSERPPISAGESDCLRTDSRSLLHAEDHIPRSSTCAYSYGNISFLQDRIHLAGKDLIETDIVTNRGENRRVSC